jgi:hypothetical protein
MRFTRQLTDGRPLRVWVVCLLLAGTFPCAGATTRPDDKVSRPETRPAVQLNLQSALNAADAGLAFRNAKYPRLTKGRDDRMTRIADLAASLPSGQSLECVAIDTFSVSGADMLDCHWVMAYHLEPPAPDTAKNLDAAGGHSLSSPQWEYLKPFAEKIGTWWEPEKRPAMIDYYDLAIVSYYDGKEWQRRLWHDAPTNIAQRRDRKGTREFNATMNLLWCFLPAPNLNDNYVWGGENFEKQYDEWLKEKEAQKPGSVSP